MKLCVVIIFALIAFVSSEENDIEELSLTFNQIKNLIANFNNENLLKAIKFAEDITEMSKNHENRILKRVFVRNESISKAQLIESLPDDEAKSVDRVAQKMFKASSYLLNRYCKSTGVPNKDCVKFMSKYSLPDSNLTTECQEVKNVYLSFRRMLPASYSDGLSSIRRTVSGKELPLSRVISNIFFKSGVDGLKRTKGTVDIITSDEGILDTKKSLSIVQWTQFLEHDLSKPVSRSMSDESAIECCDKESSTLQPRFVHDSCYPLKVPNDDQNYKKFYVTCLNYVRSALAVNEQCKFGSINQLNQATNKLDLSQLYGYDEDDQNKLRLNIQGLLKTSTDDTALLPKITSNDLCYNLDNKTSCYFSGDTRVNSNPTVTVLYTLFLRSHNQIAQKLKRMNPKWSDEELFAVTKDINVAIYQKFIYNDWANAVLGKRLALDIRNKNDDAKKYKSDKVSNEFGTVAIRFYNSMQPGDLFEIPTHARSHSKSTENLVDSGRMKEIMKLQDTFFQPKDLSRGNFFDQLVSTVLRQKAMAMDTSYVDDLAIQLYRSKMHDSQIFGTDSLALDIQRARDHGIQSYTNYIKKCLNIRINQWSDLRNIIREDDLHRLRSIYESVFDVDLIVGGLSEIPKENATVGPTFACILSDQLMISRISDENFYNRRSDNHGEKIAKTVEKYSATRFICDNTKQKKVQRNIFLVPSEENPLINCSDYEQLPKLDLSYFLIPSAV